MAGLLDAARAAAPLAAEHARESERNRRLAEPVNAALRDGGIYAMLAPRSLGGGEADLLETIEVLETLGAADGSAGWCAMVSATSGLSLAWLEAGAAREVFPSPTTVLAGVFAPRGRARRGGGELEVSGRWPFASNVQNGEWVLGGCLVEEEAPLLALFRREQVEVIDTWHVAGLRGTGSDDFAVEGVALPERLTARTDLPPAEQGPLYAIPLFSTLAVGIAAVALGIGAAAVDDFVALASAKVPTGSRRRLAEREVVQAGLARARAGVRSARALLREEAAAAGQEVERGDPLSLERRAALRLAATHAVGASVRAADEVFGHAGASAVYETSTLQRRFRDLHVAAQHLMVAPPTYELAGRVELGLGVEGRGF